MANPNPKTGHLSPWQPGQSGNSKGYSKARRVTDALLKQLEDPDIQKRLAEIWIAQALTGNFQFFRELLDRTEGKVPTPVEVDAKPVVDWSTIDVECDTPPRPNAIESSSTDSQGLQQVPESGQA